MKRLVLEEELVECRRNSGESESGGVKMRLKSNLRLRLQGICLGNLSLGFKISESGGGGAYLLILALDRGKWIIIIILSGLSPNFSSFLFAYRC